MSCSSRAIRTRSSAARRRFSSSRSRASRAARSRAAARAPGASGSCPRPRAPRTRAAAGARSRSAPGSLRSARSRRSLRSPVTPPTTSDRCRLPSTRDRVELHDHHRGRGPPRVKGDDAHARAPTSTPTSAASGARVRQASGAAAATARTYAAGRQAALRAQQALDDQRRGRDHGEPDVEESERAVRHRGERYSASSRRVIGRADGARVLLQEYVGAPPSAVAYRSAAAARCVREADDSGSFEP